MNMDTQKRRKGKRKSGSRSSLFAPDGEFVRVLNGLSDMIILNLLCVLCSLPIVTAGASITSCYRYSFRILQERDTGVVRGFFRGFRENFRQVTPVWLGLLAVAGVLYADWNISAQIGGTFQTVLRTVVLVGGVLLLTELVYVFPLMATFINTRRACLKNALIMGVRHLPQTLAMFLITLSPVWVTALLPSAVGWLVFIGLVIWVEIIIMGNTAFLSRIFPLYMPKEENKTS